MEVGSLVLQLYWISCSAFTDIIAHRTNIWSNCFFHGNTFLRTKKTKTFIVDLEKYLDHGSFNSFFPKHRKKESSALSCLFASFPQTLSGKAQTDVYTSSLLLKLLPRKCDWLKNVCWQLFASVGSVGRNSNSTQTRSTLCTVDTVALKMRLVKKTATSPPLGRQPQ